MKVERVSYPGGGTLGVVAVSGQVPSKRAAVLLTSSFKPADTVNVIVYYHGHWVGVKSFDGLLGFRTTTGMMAGAQGAGKSLAIGIPDMGANANNPKVDWMYQAASFDRFIEDILLFAAQRANELRSGMCLKDPSKDHRSGQEVKPLGLGNLVLAAHSGGGYPLWRTVHNKSSYLAQLKEVWMFDSLYGGFGVSPESWANWIRKSGIKVRNFYTPEVYGKIHATRINTEALEGIRPPVRQFQTQRPPDTDHHTVPGSHIKELIKESSAL